MQTTDNFRETSKVNKKPNEEKIDAFTASSTHL